MQAFANSFDVDNVEWHHIRGEPGDAYNLDYEYSLLGYDLAAGKLIRSGDTILDYGA